jgi:hypothetical protein
LFLSNSYPVPKLLLMPRHLQILDGVSFIFDELLLRSIPDESIIIFKPDDVSMITPSEPDVSSKVMFAYWVFSIFSAIVCFHQINYCKRRIFLISNNSIVSILQALLILLDLVPRSNPPNKPVDIATITANQLISLELLESKGTLDATSIEVTIIIIKNKTWKNRNIALLIFHFRKRSSISFGGCLSMGLVGR